MLSPDFINSPDHFLIEIKGGEENKNIQNQNNVADFQKMAAAADEQRRDFRSVKNRAAANRQPDACADKKSAENGS